MAESPLDLLKKVSATRLGFNTLQVKQMLRAAVPDQAEADRIGVTIATMLRIAECDLLVTRAALYGFYLPDSDYFDAAFLQPLLLANSEPTGAA